jgi:hypothetical protein
VFQIPNQKDKRKDIYRLTQKGIDLYPIMLEMILWGIKYNPDTDEYYKTMLPLIKKGKQAYVKKRLREISDFAKTV